MQISIAFFRLSIGSCPFGGCVFVGHEAREPEIRDGLHHEAVIQLLRVVDLVTARIAAGVEVADPLEVVADVPDDVAVHDLAW